MLIVGAALFINSAKIMLIVGAAPFINGRTNCQYENVDSWCSTVYKYIYHVKFGKLEELAVTSVC